MGAIAPQLDTIIGSNRVCGWENLDFGWKNRISRAIAPGVIPECVVFPQTPEELSTVVAAAKSNGWRLLPCGNGSKLHWGGVATAADLVVSTQRLDRVIEHAVGEFTLTVEAGAKLSEIRTLLAKENQFLALDPSYENAATLGGIVATGDTGSWRHRYNSVRDRVLGISFARSDGKLAKAGGRVVKNVAGYDLMKLLTGSYGTLGIISQLTFRLYPIPDDSATLVLTGETEAIATAKRTLLASGLTPTAIDLLSPNLVREVDIDRGNLGLLVRLQTVPESVQDQSEKLEAIARELGLKSTRFRDREEELLGQKITDAMDDRDTETAIVCKVGVLPTATISLLENLASLFGEAAMARIYIGSGLGMVKIEELQDRDRLLKLRQFCQENRGFLTLLSASKGVKQAIDIWGYNGNAIELMQNIKNQFDPDGLLNRDRFVV